ncbi:MAG TPA: hypothetical protein VKH46_06625 [Thermoanaerobaculia bacterium]|jgi:hypothetical protein|nr:hypothetical protein [Thermoanaerobaculia bacterium]
MAPRSVGPSSCARQRRARVDVDQEEIDRVVADLYLAAGAPPVPLATPGSPDLEFPEGKSGERVLRVALGITAILLVVAGLRWACASFDHGAIAISVIATVAVGWLIIKEALQVGWH